MSRRVAIYFSAKMEEEEGGTTDICLIVLCCFRLLDMCVDAEFQATPTSKTWWPSNLCAGIAFLQSVAPQPCCLRKLLSLSVAVRGHWAGEAWRAITTL